MSDDDDWGKPLSQDPADIAAREAAGIKIRSTTQRVLRWSYLVLAILIVVVIILATR